MKEDRQTIKNIQTFISCLSVNTKLYFDSITVFLLLNHINEHYLDKYLKSQFSFTHVNLFLSNYLILVTKINRYMFLVCFGLKPHPVVLLEYFCLCIKMCPPMMFEWPYMVTQLGIKLKMEEYFNSCNISLAHDYKMM